MDSFFYKLLEDELKPATGCTEPIAIAYAASLAFEHTDRGPVKRVEITASVNVIKNAMGVTIPGTSLHGVFYAAALGIQVPSSGKLQLLDNLKEVHITSALNLVEDARFDVSISSSHKKLFIEVLVETQSTYGKVTIEDVHDQIMNIEADGKVIFRNSYEAADSSVKWPDYQLSDIWSFVSRADLRKLKSVTESIRINKKIGEHGLQNEYGIRVGRSIYEGSKHHATAENYAVALSAAAADARMGGAKLSAMSNTGSGNQGITATLPVLAYFESSKNKDEDKLYRATTLSHLTTIYIKSKIGRLSAVCGANIAAMGAAGGITYIQGGSEEAFYMSIQNMIGNVSGMICDGAKSGCALKVATSVNAAVMSSNLAMQGICIGKNKGLVSDEVESSILNLVRLSHDGLEHTDKTILDIMTKR